MIAKTHILMTMLRTLCFTIFATTAVLGYAQKKTLVVDVATHPYKGTESVLLRDVESVEGSDFNADEHSSRYFTPCGDKLTIVMRDGTTHSWPKDDVSALNYGSEAPTEINYSVLLENERVHRFVNEVVYDPNDYEYTLVKDYRIENVPLDEPRPIVIRFESDHQYGQESVLLYRKADYSDVPRQAGLDGDSLVIWNSIPGEALYYRIVDADGTSVLQQGEARGYGQVRMIYAPSVNNIRDFGGWPVEGGGHVRYGRFYRGAKLHDANNLYLSAEDSVRLRELGIVCEFDLRGSTEAGGGNTANNYSRLGKDVDYRIVPHGMYAYAAAVKEHPEYFRFGWNQIKAHVFAGDPIFMHCSHGCDRMGTWALVINGVLGVSENDLNLDYELSAFAPKTGLWRYRNEHQTVPDYDFRETIGYIKSLPGEKLRDKFEYFLVKKCLIPQTDIDALRRQLIDNE